MKKYIYLIMTILIMIGIFYFSNQPGNISSVQSAGLLNLAGVTSDETFEAVKDGTLTEGANKAYDVSSFIIRKGAHISIYFLLALFIMLTLRAFANEKSIYLMGTSIALLYALSDEFHQSFVFGRSGTLKDVFVDAIGIGIAVHLLILLENRKKINSV